MNDRQISSCRIWLAFAINYNLRSSCVCKRKFRQVILQLFRGFFRCSRILQGMYIHHEISLIYPGRYIAFGDCPRKSEDIALCGGQVSYSNMLCSDRHSRGCNILDLVMTYNSYQAVLMGLLFN